MTDSRELAFAKELALQAGTIMKRYFRSDDINTTYKADNTPVTVADTEINELVHQAVAREFPGYSFVGEEGSEVTDSEYAWVCDPIDGTHAYSIGLPTACFTLGLVKGGEVQVGLVYDPWCERLYWAERGQGAYLNGVRMMMREELPFTPGRKGVCVQFNVWSGTSMFPDTHAYTKLIDRLQQQRGRSVYAIGSVAYAAAMVASGSLHGVVFSGEDPWDTAGASLLIEEAGGRISNLYGDPVDYDGRQPGLIASHPRLHEELVRVVRDVEPRYAGANK